MIIATDIFCLNELGKRANNEDCVYPQKGSATPNDRLFIVCDGVGGEKKGEVASDIVCTSIREFLKKEPAAGGEQKPAIDRAIQYANERLAMYAEADDTAKRMSTTLALVLLGEQSITAAWCGDTRIHHIRDGKVVWKSKDHSLVSELVSQGEITEEEAVTHPRRNVITRSLNALNFNNNVDFHEITNFKTDDYLLLCTDGFLEKVNENIIDKVLSDENLEDKARGFLSYCDGLTKDNFSMYLVRGRHAKRKMGLPTWQNVLIILVVLLIAVAFILFVI